jgi:hypothetical protein
MATTAAPTILAILDIDAPTQGWRAQNIGGNEYANFRVSFRVLRDGSADDYVYAHPMHGVTYGGQLDRDGMRERLGDADWYALNLNADTNGSAYCRSTSPNDLEAIAKVLRTIEKRMSAMCDVRHYPRSSGEALGRILEAMRVDRVRIRYGSERPRECATIGDAVDMVQQGQRAWRRVWAPTAEETAAAEREKASA